jgi:hypothetical protein
MLGLHLFNPDKIHLRETADKCVQIISSAFEQDKVMMETCDFIRDWDYLLPLLVEMDASFDVVAKEMRVLVAAIEDAVSLYHNGTVASPHEGSSCVLVESNSGEQACVNSETHAHSSTVLLNLTHEDTHDISRLSPQGMNLLHELDDSIQILALRAKQVRLLYQSRDLVRTGSTTHTGTHTSTHSTAHISKPVKDTGSASLDGSVDSEEPDVEVVAEVVPGAITPVDASGLQIQARELIIQASEIVARREDHYRYVSLSGKGLVISVNVYDFVVNIERLGSVSPRGERTPQCIDMDIFGLSTVCTTGGEIRAWPNKALFR